MVTAILLITLNISIASNWILKWWTLKELSSSRSYWNDATWSLQIILRILGNGCKIQGRKYVELLQGSGMTAGYHYRSCILCI